jgi:hypothetical protein
MQPYRFMEVSMACTSVQAMEDFWTGMFGGKVLFRGLMAGQPLSRMIARFTMTPALVREWQKKQDPGGGAYLQTTYIAPPLSRERISSGEYRHDVAIFPGPDNLWIELNEVHEPADAQWFPA